MTSRRPTEELLDYLVNEWSGDPVLEPGNNAFSSGLVESRSHPAIFLRHLSSVDPEDFFSEEPSIWHAQIEIIGRGLPGQAVQTWQMVRSAARLLHKAPIPSYVSIRAVQPIPVENAPDQNNRVLYSITIDVQWQE